MMLALLLALTAVGGSVLAWLIWCKTIPRGPRAVTAYMLWFLPTALLIVRQNSPPPSWARSFAMAMVIAAVLTLTAYLRMHAGRDDPPGG